MARARPSAAPLDPPALEKLALAYVQRFQTTRARLCRYLQRKIAERGWAGADPPALAALGERMALLGLVDDRAFAEARARAALARAHGRARLRQQLSADGVAEADRWPALAALDPLTQAIAYARRRRLGPFGPRIEDRRQRERQIGAMVRAGHPLGIARQVVEAPDEAALAALLP
jgi:regulatory protein